MQEKNDLGIKHDKPLWFCEVILVLLLKYSKHLRWPTF